MPTQTVNLQPVRARLLAVVGDPFEFRVILRDPDGDPIDVTLWDFRATVSTGRVRIDFEWAADDTGVSFWMRGDDTARLPQDREFPFDVAARQPTAGEGSTVLSGEMVAARRVTDPLRNDPELVPA
jgi:hypothetical protein